jgi:hypothetical protein
MRTVLATFTVNHDAQRAIQELARQGIDREQISLIHRDPSDPTPATPEEAASTSRHWKGAAVGGVTGLLAGSSLLLIPGIGPAVIAGALVAALVAAGGGASIGGLVGALTGWGISEEHATRYTDHVRGGATLLAVHLPDDTRTATVESILQRNNGSHAEPHAISAIQSHTVTPPMPTPPAP